MTTWLLLFILFLLIEILTVNLITIWFAIGALFSFITAMMTNNIFIQATVFIVVSILTLILTRPLAKKYLLPKIEKTNLDKLVGETAVVTKTITKNEIGEVKVEGKYWSAKANKKIKEGSEVEILSIEGVKLIVKEKEEKEQ